MSDVHFYIIMFLNFQAAKCAQLAPLSIHARKVSRISLIRICINVSDSSDIDIS